jgi:D-alanyl-lipoteichoic acid acyltransferase DltB (MBOAT superfamily)
MVTFLVSGLWHGANWTYVMWGGLHGLLQITEDATSRARKKIAPWLGIKTDSSMAKLGKVILTFLLVTCCWIFFRSDTITDAVGFIQNIVRLWDPWVLADGSFYTWAFTSYEWNILLVSLIVLFLFDYIRSQKHMRIDQFLMEQGALGKGIVICFLFFLIFAYGIYGGYDESQFIYFQF